MKQQLLEKGKRNLLKINENIFEDKTVNTACFQQLAIVFTNLPNECLVELVLYVYYNDLQKSFENSDIINSSEFEINLQQIISKPQESVNYFRILSQKLHQIQSKNIRTSTHNSHRIILNKELYIVECISTILSGSYLSYRNDAMRNLLLHLVFEYNYSSKYRFDLRKNSAERIDYLIKILSF